MMPSLPALRPLSLFLASFLCLAPLTGQAARSYQVDLVVFSLQNSPMENDETWTDNPPPLDSAMMSRAVSPLKLMEEVAEDATEQAVETAPAPAAVKTTDQAEKEVDFDKVLSRLKGDPRRKILLTASWVQSVEGPNTTRVIRITDEPLGEDAPATDAPQPIERYGAVSPGGMPIDADLLMAEQPPLLDGYVSFYLSEYYTLDLDIRFTPEVSFLDMEDPANPEYTSYRIREKRRMKSDELNYYDHPRFGVLLLVNPAPAPEQPAATPVS